MARETKHKKRITQVFDNNGSLEAENSYNYEELLSIVCDICGMKGYRENDWSSSMYDVEETEVSIKYKSGTVYPEGGSTTTKEYDICPKCFENTLAPFLESKGCSAIDSESEF